MAMPNRCENCKKFMPAGATKCPRCEPDTGQLFADPGYAVELLPRFRFELKFPNGEKVLLWVEGEDEVDGLATMLEQAAGALRDASNAVAP